MNRTTSLSWLLLGLALASSSHGEEPRPIPDPVAQPGEPAYAVAHYKPAGGWVGDVHPFRWKDRWYIAYLKPPAGPLRAGIFGIVSALIVSDDLLTWEEVPVQSDDPSRRWWLIGMFAGEDKLYSFYNGDKGIDLATSTDATHWHREEVSPVIPYETSGLRELRDPSVVKIADNDYRMVFLGRLKDDPRQRLESGGFFVSKSRDLIEWSPPEALYIPGNINGPECPELFPLGGHYFLLGSPGVDRVGPAIYRVSDSPDGPWRIADTTRIDSEHFPAPNSVQDGEHRLIWSWIPTFAGRKDFANSNWGGHLTFPRELYSDARGNLLVRPPRELEALRGEKIYPSSAMAAPTFEGLWEEKEGWYSTPPGSEFARMWLSRQESRFELNATITFGEDAGAGGFAFRAGTPSMPGYEVLIDPVTQTMTLRHHNDHLRALATSPIRISRNTPMNLRIYVDGDIVEAFFDNKFSLLGRAHEFPQEGRMGFFTNSGAFAVSGISLHRLKTLYNLSEPPIYAHELKLDTTRGPGGSVYFGRLYANAYADASPRFQFSGSYTMECWYRAQPGTGSRKRNLIAKAGGTDVYHYGLNLTTSNGAEFYALTPSGYVGFNSPPGSFVEENQWIQIIAVADVDSKTIRLYKNGVEVAVGENLDATLTQNPGPIRLGYAAGMPAQDAFIGAMDRVRLWNRALTPQEVESTTQGTTPAEGLVAAWDFTNPDADGCYSGGTGAPSMCLYDRATPFAEDALPKTATGK